MALYILFFTSAFVFLLYSIERYRQRKNKNKSNNGRLATTEKPAHIHSHNHDHSHHSLGGCCGRHADCALAETKREKKPQFEYYDDEELDAFAQREASSYLAEEKALFQEVFATLQVEDRAGWAQSLQERDIALPAEIARQLQT